ncbi:aminoglycoside phosphotransferase family protein [Phormidium tenue FACHB-886]|nr:aminoglycoside phosphotransferase family protein [Phormidium tenue FACHB-886]
MLLLNHENICQYLVDSGIFSQQELAEVQLNVGKSTAKNYSIILTLKDARTFIVKQERPLPSGIFSQELANEWQFQKMIEEIPELNLIQGLVREMLFYDQQNLIAVCSFFSDHKELFTDILKPQQLFPVAIPVWIGSALARIHRTTFNRKEAFDFVTQEGSFWRSKGAAFTLLQDRITPEMLSIASPDYIKFISLYQRYESLERAKQEAVADWHPCCIVHNDLNVANILVHQDWEQIGSLSMAQRQCMIRIIDWERCSWGDPVLDLSSLIANYLMLWISSMIIDPTMNTEESVDSASVKLEDIRPSIIALLQQYLDHFPEIVKHFPNFFKKLTQFTGLSIIIQAQAKIEHHKLLANSDVYALQVAKSLLCRPQHSFLSVFGVKELDLVPSLEVS